MELRKLKLSKSGVQLVSVSRLGPEQEIVIEQHTRSPHAPHHDLVDAMTAFLQPALALLELPSHYRTECTVATIVVSEQKAGMRGLQINLVKKLKQGSRPLNLTTPLLVEEPEMAEDDLRHEFLDLLSTVTQEAEAYMSGKRAQGELALHDGPEGARAAGEEAEGEEEVEV